MKILVTGTAGFIGNHVALTLLKRGDEVIGLDNLSPYYDVQLKRDRLKRLEPFDGFRDVRMDLADREAVAELFRTERPQRVVNLAAQAGVRYSLENPHSYADSNLVGFLNVLEGCRAVGVEHLVYASSSSVFGANKAMPFREDKPADHPLSLYAATKKANEVMAHSYAHLFDIPVTGLRFFTVYGPWGRPDMALFKFTKAILEGEPIDLYNRGDMERDFTYIDDIVEGVVRALDNPAQVDPSWNAEAPRPDTSGVAPHRVFNIGNGQPERLTRYIEVVEETLGKKAEKRLLPMQPGDVPATRASTESLEAAVGYRPSTPIEVGVRRFVEWYQEYYGKR